MNENKEPDSYRNYYRIQMQRELIIKKMRERGCRITKQRLTILDIILSESLSSCKEIYYLASQTDPSIGAATVYRMVNLLEEIGAISRTRLYEINCWQEEPEDAVCTVEMDDHSRRQLSGEELNTVMQEGLRAKGWLDSGKVVSVFVGRAEETDRLAKANLVS